MPANLENLAVATRLKEDSFHSNPKERQCQKLFKLPHNCTNLICQQSNAQNSPSKASTVHELRTSRCSSWIQKRERNQRSNATIKKDNSRKTSTSALLTTPKPLTVQIVGNSERGGNTRPSYLSPVKPVCRLRSNSQNWTWNNRLVPNRQRCMSRLYTVTLLI